MVNEEKCLVFIKPCNFDRAVEIFAYLEDMLKGQNADFERTLPVHIRNVRRETIEKHYSHIRHIPNYEATIQAFTGGDMILAVYSGRGVCRKIREIIGNTDPLKAKGRLRGVFSKESLEEAMKENKYLNNVIHASADSEEARDEIIIWQAYLGN